MKLTARGQRRIAFHQAGKAIAVGEGRKILSENSGVGHRRHWAAGDLNVTEQLVLGVLTDKWITAADIAGLVEISVGSCRRALATLRVKGLAQTERIPGDKKHRTVWRRA
jgi:hypothetical protein